jgi:polyketide synthase 12/myxalamid-type polyketide synthase MxaB
LLIEREPVFRAVMEQCDACLQPLAGWSLMAEFLADAATDRAAEIEVAQPVTLALQVALAALWRSWGIVPDLIVDNQDLRRMIGQLRDEINELKSKGTP